MKDPKTAADRQHDRLIGDIEARERRAEISIKIPVSDLRRAVRSLASRAEQIAARRDRDPVLRAAADAESRACRRLADLFEGKIREAHS